MAAPGRRPTGSRRSARRRTSATTTTSGSTSSPGGVAALNASSRGRGSPVRGRCRRARSPRPRVDGLDDEELRAVSLGRRRAGSCWSRRPGRSRDSPGATRSSTSPSAGYRSLIAHPERHLAADLRERLAALVALRRARPGDGRLSSRARRRAGMLALAERGLVHVLGSDAHSSRAGRPVRCRPALERLARRAACRAPPRVDRATTRRAAIVARRATLEPPFEPV